MPDWLANLLSVYFLISFVAFYKWYKYAQNRKLREQVAWSALGGYCLAMNQHSYTKEPFFEVLNAQYADSIDEKYRISSEVEERYLREIIEAYQSEIMRSYFRGHLTTIKSKYAVDGNVYFLIKFHDFLAGHSDGSKFLGHDMQTSAHSASDFQVVYYKLLYITHMYCKKSPIANPSQSQSWYDWEEKNAREFLDSIQIQQP